jgi:hypothetical protein
VIISIHGGEKQKSNGHDRKATEAILDMSTTKKRKKNMNSKFP